MATGKITQIIGAVIDVEFPRDSIPEVYEALKLVDADLTRTFVDVVHDVLREEAQHRFRVTLIERFVVARDERDAFTSHGRTSSDGVPFTPASSS